MILQKCAICTIPADQSNFRIRVLICGGRLEDPRTLATSEKGIRPYEYPAMAYGSLI